MRRLLLAVLFVFALPGAALAQDNADPLEAITAKRAEQVVEVMQGEMKPEEVLSAQFRQIFPPERMAATAVQTTGLIGAFKGIDNYEYRGNGAATFEIVHERGRSDAMLQVDAAEPHHVVTLKVTPHNVGGSPRAAFNPKGGSLGQVIAEIGALPGKASIGIFALVDKGPRSILDKNSSEQFEVDSTFKLYVLSTLVQQVKAGMRHWGDVVPVDAHSFVGKMQNWPIGAPVTLHTLATLMIMDSDNTATDVLMRVLGRKTIEAELVASGHSDPGRDMPFLTTIEDLALKTGDQSRIDAFSAADTESRRALLDKWAPTLTFEHVDPQKLLGASPKAIDTIGWFASNEDIARIYQRIRDSGDPKALKILAINTLIPPMQVELEGWDYVGFKDGSEPGVISGSWILRDKQGHWFVVSASWNDPDHTVQPQRLIDIGIQTIGLIAPAHE